jgi:hypothetical protein
MDGNNNNGQDQVSAGQDQNVNSNNKDNNNGQNSQLSIDGIKDDPNKIIEDLKTKMINTEKTALAYQSQLAKQAEENKKYQEELNKYRELEAQKQKEELEREEQKLREKGNVDELMKRANENFKLKESEYQEKLKQFATTNAELGYKLENNIINNNLNLALSKYDVLDMAKPAVIEMLKKHIKVTENYENLYCTHYKTTEATTLDQLVKDYLTEHNYAVRDTTPSGAGTPKQTVNNKSLTPDEQLINDIFRGRGSNELNPNLRK